MYLEACNRFVAARWQLISHSRPPASYTVAPRSSDWYDLIYLAKHSAHICSLIISIILDTPTVSLVSREATMGSLMDECNTARIKAKPTFSVLPFETTALNIVYLIRHESYTLSDFSF